MKSSTFQDAVESSAKVIGRKAVNVVFEGDRAETDGDTVYLPALPPSADINIEQAEIIRGFRDHETMHVRCTATDKATMKMLEEATQKNESVGKLIQFTEDIRIEHAGVSEYAGMKTSLTAIQTHAAKQLLEQLETKGDPLDVITMVPRHIQLRLMLQAMGRAKIGITSGGLYGPLIEAIRKQDQQIYDFADQWSDKMVALPTGYNGKTLVESTARKGTKESFDLAHQLYKAFGELTPDNPPPPPPPPQPDGQPGDGDGGDGDGEGGDSQGQPGTKGSGDAKGKGGGKGSGSGDGDDDGDSGSGDGDEDDSDDDSGDSGQGGGDEGGDDGSGQGGGGDDGGGQGDSTSGSTGGGHGSNKACLPDDAVDIDNLFQDALRDVVGQVSQGPELETGGERVRRFQVYTKKFNLVLPVRDFVVASKQGHSLAGWVKVADAMIAQIEKEVSGKKAMIRRLLELELQARSDRRWGNGHKSGRLQSVRLVQALQGRETVYQRREDGKDMDTLLEISIDGSGSMNGERLKDAMALSYALSEALERTGCDIIVKVWGNVAIPKARYSQSTYHETDVHNLNYEVGQLPSGVRERFAATGLLTRAVVKYKHQRTTDPAVRTNFGLGVYAAGGSTPSHAAIFADLADLGREQYAKKIYLHVTDGDPDSTINGLSNETLMKEAHEYAEAMKVHMIGVGITGMNVDHMFKDHINVKGSDAYEPVIKRLAKLVAQEAGHATAFKRAA